MPRVLHRIIKNKSASDLKILLESLIVHIEKSHGIDSLEKGIKTHLSNVLSYYKKIDELSQEEINVIWETANFLVDKILNKKSEELIEKEKSDKRVDDGNLLYGKYWVFPKTGKFVKCDDHLQFARDNGDVFVKNLGVDAYDFFHAVNSGEKRVLPIIFAAGGIMANFVMESRKKVARFQLAQCSMPWLKRKIMKMPMQRCHVRVLNPHEDYVDEKTGIYFLFRRPVKD